MSSADRHSCFLLFKYMLLNYFYLWCWIGVRTDILVLFLVSGGQHSVFTIKHDVNCRCFAVALYQVVEVPLYSLFAVFFCFHSWMDVVLLNVFSTSVQVIDFSWVNFSSLSFKDIIPFILVVKFFSRKWLLIFPYYPFSISGIYSGFRFLVPDVGNLCLISDHFV